MCGPPKMLEKARPVERMNAHVLSIQIIAFQKGHFWLNTIHVFTYSAHIYLMSLKATTCHFNATSHFSEVGERLPQQVKTVEKSVQRECET